VDPSVDWRGAASLAEAENWMRSRLGDAGIALSGPIEQVRMKPWSTHLAVSTSHGRYWLKENCPVLRFEGQLVRVLAELVPGRVLQPLAIDGEHGWMLTPDGGSTLDQYAMRGDAFGDALTEYGVLQRVLVDHAAEVIATGLPVIRAEGAADRFERALGDLTRLPVDHPLHVGPELLTGSARNRHLCADAAVQLSELALPDSLQHNDLQPSNVFAPTGGGPRFFDFGDAVWSHPFCVLDVALHRISQSWKCSSEDRRIGRLRDLYLDGWTNWAPIDELRRLVEPSMVIARLHRYNSWHQLIPYMPENELRRHAGYAAAIVFGR
jgi:hypothetical protein